MRPFEILLSLANLLAFLTLTIPRLHALRWAGYACPIALGIAAAEMLAEGPRWQMAPAYAIAALLFAIWLAGAVVPGGLQIHRVVSIIGAGLGGLALAVSIALPGLLPVFHFPTPTGPYAIGTVTYHWVDESRPELFTADPNDHRELMAQVWYPAQAEPSAPRAPYMPEADAVTPTLARLVGFPDFFFSHFKYVTTHAVTSAPVADDQPSYPVLIVLSGLDGYRQVSTFQVEELVSHGYIVVGLNQPGAVALVRFPDGRQVSGLPKAEIDPSIMQSVEREESTPVLFGTPLPDGIIPYFGQDVSFALDQLAALNESDPNHLLTGRLDLDRAGAFGISLGGMVAGDACLHDARLKACLVMDVYMTADVVEAGLQQPVMWITRDADTMRLERERSGGWSEKDIALTIDTMRDVYERLPGDGYYLQIPGIFHLNFTDAPYWSPVFPQVGLTSDKIDRQRAFDIINVYSAAFFDQYLRGQTSPLLDGPSSAYPEVIFESRRGKASP